MNVLIACEESQAVCIEMRRLGHRAFSCDIQECSGGHPEWHIQGDCLPLLNGYKGLEDDPTTFFWTQDGTAHSLPPRWDLIIAHPPCTFLTVTGNRWFNVERYGDKAKQRQHDRYQAIVFFMHFALACCDHIAIENPVGVMGSAWRSADQIIQPWQFGHPTVKKTCLWLKGLPKLIPTDVVKVDKNDVYEYVAKNGHIKHDSRSRSQCRTEERAKHRSKTFPGIARAMAEQWAGENKKEEAYERTAHSFPGKKI